MKIWLLYCYAALWIHNIDAICTDRSKLKHPRYIIGIPAFKIRGKSSSMTFSFKKDKIANFWESLDSLILEYLSNCHSKCAKRSAMNRTMNFRKSIMSNVDRRPSHIRVLHTYDIFWMV